jgi:hypothetical protein
MGRWQLTYNTGYLGGDVVRFYALYPAGVGRSREALRQYAPALPKSVRVLWDY